MKNVEWSRKVVSFTNLWKKFVCRTARFSKSLAGGSGSVEIASTRIQDVFPRCGFMFFLRSFPKYGAGRSRLFVGSRSDVVARRFPLREPHYLHSNQNPSPGLIEPYHAVDIPVLHAPRNHRPGVRPPAEHRHIPRKSLCFRQFVQLLFTVYDSL